MLAIMFSGKYHVEKDSSGRYFIDRDGELFKYDMNIKLYKLNANHSFQRVILKYLRTDNLSFDQNDIMLVNELLEEAKFYQIKPLISRLSEIEEIQTNIESQKALKKQLRLKERRPEYTRIEIHQMKVKHTLSSVKSKLNLVGLYLAGIDLSGLDLSNCDFSGCDLTNASFENAKLIGTVFCQSYLRNANFQQCLLGSRFNEETDFTDSYLGGANFSRYSGTIYKTHMVGAEIENCIGIDESWLK